MTIDARAAAEQVVSVAPTSHAYAFPERVVVGVDENLNSPLVWIRLRAAVVLRPTFMAIALWHEVRERASGERILVPGGHPIGVQDGFDWGRPLQYNSETDEEIVSFALVHLYSYRRVVVLSGDRKMHRGELRWILTREVAPVLNSTFTHGLSLALLSRLPNTTVDDYAIKLWAFLSTGRYEVGYREHSL